MLESKPESVRDAAAYDPFIQSLISLIRIRRENGMIRQPPGGGGEVVGSNWLPCGRRRQLSAACCACGGIVD